MNTRSSGSWTSRNARASGRAAASSCVSRPNTLSSHQRATSGNDSSRSVSPGRRAVDDDRVPLAGLPVALDLQQAEQLVAAGRHAELLGGDAVHAALGQHAAEPALHAATSCARAPPGPAPAGRTGRRRRRSARRRPASRARRRASARGPWRARSRARPAAAMRRAGGGGDRRLADAALPGVEDRPRAPSGRRAYGASAPRLEDLDRVVERRAVARQVRRVDATRRRRPRRRGTRSAAPCGRSRSTALRRTATARAAAHAHASRARSSTARSAARPVRPPRSRRVTSRSAGASVEVAREVRLGVAEHRLRRAVAQRRRGSRAARRGS